MAHGRTTTVFGIQVPDSLHTKIKEAAQTKGESVSPWCRKVLERALDSVQTIDNMTRELRGLAATIVETSGASKRAKRELVDILDRYGK